MFSSKTGSPKTLRKLALVCNLNVCNECNFRNMNVMNETLAAWIMFLNFYFCLPICWSTGNKQCEKAISRSLNNSCTCFYLHCSFGFVLSNAFSHNSAQIYILISSCPLKIFWLSYTCHYNPLLITKY